jgi:protein gp37
MMKELSQPAIVRQAEDRAARVKALHAAIQKSDAVIRKHGEENLGRAIELGKELLEERKLFPARAGKESKGPRWYDWLEGVGINPQTALDYMAVAEGSAQLDWGEKITTYSEALAYVRQQRQVRQSADAPVAEKEEDESEVATPTAAPPSKPARVGLTVCQEPVAPPADPGSPKVGGKLGRGGADYVTLEAWEALSESEQGAILAPKDSTSKFTRQTTESIEWALWSWNPVTGCLHDCPYCYARDIANRLYEPGFAPSLWPKRLAAPSNTPFPEEKAADWMGHKNVFVCSMADLFGRWVPTEWIEAVLKACADASQWNFLFLTKFPNRMSDFYFSDNCWVGTTVDCQKRVKNAERAFASIKARVKWLSCEPLLEPLEFKHLSVFDWVVIGGASSSTQTPEWHPPFAWYAELWREATRNGCKVYFKTNLEGNRLREYPGVEPKVEKAPAELVYLPSEVG